MTQTIRIYHSPDADDRFMFWPLKEQIVKNNRFSFEFYESDTQKLNNIADLVGPEICAISAIHYGRVCNKYQPLSMGCSVGNGYGPILVSKNSSIDCLKNKASSQTILLTPGEKTTAHAIVHLLGFSFAQFEVVPIAPMEKIFERLSTLTAEGKKVVALLIHEGRLIYKNYGTELVLDIGQKWCAETKTPLPLGMNVIRRDLPEEVKRRLSDLLTQSCRYAMDHRENFIEKAIGKDSLYKTPLSAKELREYLDMYANEDTLQASQNVRQGFETLLKRGFDYGLFDQVAPKGIFDWV